MKLYLLQTENYDYDEYDGFIIRALNENIAREIANSIGTRRLDTSPKVWLAAELSTCTELTIRGSQGLVFSSFNEG